MPYESEEDLIKEIHDYVTDERKLVFTYDEVKNLYLSLKTQRLVILNSRPGTGKTELSISYVEAYKSLIGDDNVEKIFITINKDYDKADLLGYVGLDEAYHPSNLVKEMFYSDGEVASNSSMESKYYFVILDEMNLSQIDFYFSDMLAAIENNEPITLPDGQDVSLPQNSFFLGTINSFTYEGTRNPVSNSVKRRANVINVKNPIDKLFTDTDNEQEQFEKFEGWLNKILEQTRDNFSIQHDFMSNFRHNDFGNFNPSSNNNLYQKLFNITEALSKTRENSLTFGILQDILEYIIFSNNHITLNKAIDIQIAQKILPSLSGDITNLTEFESVIHNNSWPISTEQYAKIKNAAENNMNQIVPLC